MTIIFSPSKAAQEASQWPNDLAIELAGWGGVGVFARCLSMGMQQRPWLERK